jgi:hypothetical protein
MPREKNFLARKQPISAPRDRSFPAEIFFSLAVVDGTGLGRTPRKRGARASFIQKTLRLAVETV